MDAYGEGKVENQLEGKLAQLLEQDVAENNEARPDE